LIEEERRMRELQRKEYEEAQIADAIRQEKEAEERRKN
jgi:hypothetical protein